MSPRALASLAALFGCYQTVDLTPPADATVGGASGGPDAFTRPDASLECPADASVTPLEWTATLPVAEDGCVAARPEGEQCTLRLDVPAGAALATWCATPLGRTPTLTEPGRCDVEQIGATGVALGARPPGRNGYYLTAGSGGACAFRVVLTDEGAMPLRNASLRCVLREVDPAPPTICSAAALGEACALQRPPGCVFAGSSCAVDAPTVLRSGTSQCAGSLCLSRREGRATDAFCTCLCEGNPRAPDCTCPAGMACAGAAEVFFSGRVQAARYCTPNR